MFADGQRRRRFAIKGAGRVDLLQSRATGAKSAIAKPTRLISRGSRSTAIRSSSAPSRSCAWAKPSLVRRPAHSCSPRRSAKKRWRALTLEALQGASRVVDLFSGIGTFALRIAEHAEVLAAEGDTDMLTALKKASDGAGGALKEVSTLRRDLLRTPLSSAGNEKVRRRRDRSAAFRRAPAGRADRPRANAQAGVCLVRSRLALRATSKC
jgi:hypothetical protein